MKYPFFPCGVRASASMFLFALVGALFFSADSFAVSIDDFEARSYDPDNNPSTTNMPYRFFAPEEQQAGEKYPVVVYLHGLGSGTGDNRKQMENHGSGGMYFAEDAWQARYPAYVIIPQEPAGSQHWHQGDVKTLLSGLIPQLLSDYPNMDPDRVYIGGISMGGNGTWSQITTFPNRYAAAFLLAGAGGTGSASKIAHMPIWLLHSNGDTVVNVNASRNRTSTLRNLGASTIYTEFDNGGHVIGPSASTIPELQLWMMQQRLGSAPQGAPLVRILEYAVGDTLSMNGVAVDEAAQISEVSWLNSLGGSGVATGTAEWSFSGAAMQSGNNLIRVTATGWPYAESDAGSTTFNQSLSISYTTPVGDMTPPSLVVTAPAAVDGLLYSTEATLAFNGTAGDETAFGSVAWATDRGQSGTATGTSDWSANIPLSLGLNRVTVTALDAVGNRRARVFYATRGEPVVNRAPRVRTGADWLLAAPNNAAKLEGTLGDDGLPVPATVSWSKVSGPGAVTFDDPHKLDAIATFSQVGDYVLRLTADDTEYQSSHDLNVKMAGGPIPVSGPGVIGINCNGPAYTASDGTEYLPGGDYVFGGGSHTDSAAEIFNTPDQTLYKTGNFGHGSVSWDMPVSNGEYIVTLKLINPNNAVGSRLGDYFVEEQMVLNDHDVRSYVEKNTALDHSVRVEVTDGVLTVRMLTVNYRPVLCAILVQEAEPAGANGPPEVEAGADQTVRLDIGAELSGSVVDDGLLPGNLTAMVTWSKLSGPGSVTFDDAHSTETNASFSRDGVYVLQLEGSDGVLSNSDTVTITVEPIPPRRFLYDFGNATNPGGNWNLVNGHFNSLILNSKDTDGNSTDVILRITEAFQNKDTTGETGVALYPDNATFDSFFTNLNRRGSFTLEGLNQAATYTLTFFATAAFDAANDGGTEFTVNGVTQSVDATENRTELVVFEGVQPDAEGVITVGVTATDDTGRAFLNLLDLQEVVNPADPFSIWIEDHFPGQGGDVQVVGPMADPDRDGRPNFLEFALRGRPNAAERQALVRCMTEGARLRIAFDRLDVTDNIIYAIQVSETLQSDDWETVATLLPGDAWSGPALVEEVGTDPVSVTVTDVVDLPASSGQLRAFRVQVTQPE